jgi:hypothetical protein
MMTKQQTRPASHTDLNGEFATPKRTTEWSCFFAALIGFTIISALNLRSWGFRNNAEGLVICAVARSARRLRLLIEPLCKRQTSSIKRRSCAKKCGIQFQGQRPPRHLPLHLSEFGRRLEEERRGPKDDDCSYGRKQGQD